MNSSPGHMNGAGSSRACLRGFTLIEVLLAVALLSIILAALYSTFFMSQKAMDGMEGSLLKLQESRAVLDTLRREVESISFIIGDKYSLCKIEDRDMYGKQTSRFTFSSFTSLTPGVAWISYYLEEKDGKLVLLKKMRSSFIAVKETDTADTGAVLMEDVESFTVEASDGATWLKTWDSSANWILPKEVRVTIKVKRGDGNLMLYEIMSPQIGINL